MREDVTDIILNLKRLVCVLHGDSGEVEARIAKDGPGVVTAGDIDAPAELEILNPELEICHLAEGARFEMMLTIGRGRGYVAADGNKRTRDDDRRDSRRLDLLADPGASRSSSTSARVGQRTDFDKLTLEISTDGSISPRDALQQAAEILIKQLAIFTDLDTDDLSALVGPGGGAAEAELPQAHGMENILIEELELGVRSYNCLKRVGIETIGDLVSKSEQELAAIPNFGKKSIEEVRETLAHARPEAEGGRVVRHQKSGRKLGRDGAHRKALYANLTMQLMEHGRIRTTLAKAKEVRPVAERMITLGKRGDLHAHRQAVAFLRSKDAAHAAVRRGGAALRRAPGRLHPHHQARSASR